MNENFNTKLFFTKEGNGNVVLFLHGWGCNGNIFCSIYPKLKNYTTVKVDLWGFGKTELPTEFLDKGMGVVDYADKIAEFIKQENLINLTVIGHSFGGRIAVVLSAKYPELVSKLVLVSSAGLKRFSLKKHLKVLHYKHLKKRAVYSEKARQKLKLKGSTDYKACNPQLKPTFLRVINEPLDKFASQIRCSTLLIWGKKDKDTPLWIAHRYKKLIKNSGLVIMKNCGHFCFLENPNLFLAILKSFLESKE